MSFKENYQKFVSFLNEDSWYSFFVSLILIVIVIKFVFFPVLAFVTGTSLPLVVVESCSMYHDSSFNLWWDESRGWYENKEIDKTDFESYSFKNGINKGDIIFVVGDKNIEKGEVIIFIGGTKYPIIHRVVSIDFLSTKGDNNNDQLPGGIEQNIDSNKVLGRAVFRVPYLGWVKLIFFDFFKPIDQRGFCK